MGWMDLEKAFFFRKWKVKYEKKNAVDFLTELLEREKISIIALGPMTNLAKVFRESRN